MRTIKFYVLIFSLFYVSFFSQQGSLDPTFNPLDVGLGAATNNVVNMVALQPDNKVIIAGNFSTYNGVNTNKIVRLNEDGTLDTTFSCPYTFSGAISGIALQPDGKIIVAGTFTGTIIRLNADGSKDTSFDTGNVFTTNVTIYDIKLRSDGVVFVAGEFALSSQGNVKVVGLNPNGGLVAAYFANGSIPNISLQTDGKLIATGSFSTFNGSAVTNSAVRVNTDGTLDSTFNAPGLIAVRAVTPDGKVYANYNAGLIRLNNDGTIDTGFNSGIPIAIVPTALEVQQNGKIVVGTSIVWNSGVNRFVRFNQDGSLDTAFDGSNGPTVNSSDTSGNPKVSDILIQPDGKIILTGIFHNFKGKKRNHIARVLADGTIDLTFNRNTGFDGAVRKMLELPDHRILVCGFFRNYNDITANGIILLNEDGSISSSFVSSGIDHGLQSGILDAGLQSDGKIILVGSFVTYNNVTKNYIARINQDGSLDPTFNIGNGASYFVKAVAIQPDGKIVIGGEFSYINGVFQRRTARLNPDGSVDPTFNRPIGTSNMGSVDEIVVQPDGKILMAGNLVYPSVAMIKINPDGSYDPAFTTPPYLANSIALQPDGKILIGGYYLIRANPNGSLDPSFNMVAINPNPNSNNNAFIQKVVLLSDNKILIGGNFLSNSSINKNGIARINSDGTIDNSFMGTGTNGSVIDMAILHDQKILIGGGFTTYSGSGKNRIARLNGNNVLNVKDVTLNKDIRIYPNPVQNILYIDAKKTVKKITIHNTLGQVMNGYKIKNASITEIDVSNLGKGIYIVNVELENGTRTFKVIKN